MIMRSDKGHIGFPGTYFDRNFVLKLANTAMILGWVLLGAYAVEWGYGTYQNVSSAILNGYPVDYYYMVISLRSLLQGAMVLVVLYVGAQMLLILLDIEDNTRRAARQAGSKPD
jgi:hypothetical protein